MKYKLINYVTKTETFCDKVTIDGFDYYVSNEDLGINKPFWGYCWNWRNKINYFENGLSEYARGRNYLPPNAPKQKIIATNNPSIDIPKVVDEVAKEAERDWIHKEYGFEVGYNPQRCVDGAVQKPKFINGYVKGYNKSQETHPNSDEDMIEFAEWIADSKLHGYSKQLYEAMIRHKVSTTKELLQLWKEQKPKIVYYDK